MALTDAQRKTLLIAEVGETGGGLLATNIDALWEKYAAYAPASADLRDLYVKRGLLDIALGDARKVVSFTSADHQQMASDLAKRLLDMRAATQQELDAEAERAQGAGGVAIGNLAAATPETPPVAPPVRPFGPDALDPPYLGSPYYPRRRVARW